MGLAEGKVLSLHPFGGPSSSLQPLTWRTYLSSQAEPLPVPPLTPSRGHWLRTNTSQRRAHWLGPPPLSDLTAEPLAGLAATCLHSACPPEDTGPLLEDGLWRQSRGGAPLSRPGWRQAGPEASANKASYSEASRVGAGRALSSSPTAAPAPHLPARVSPSHGHPARSGPGHHISSCWGGWTCLSDPSKGRDSPRPAPLLVLLPELRGDRAPDPKPAPHGPVAVPTERQVWTENIPTPSVGTQYKCSACSIS